MSNMKKALLIRITGVLVLALFISSFITYYAVGHQLLDNNITTLSETLKVIDYAIDYQDNLQEQIISLHKISFDDDTRITIIDKNGIVYADTSTKEIEGLENHIQREEIQEALREGDGSATRYSQTVEKNLLYVAKLSYDTNYILRISVPYKGISDFIYMVIPFLLLGIGIAFIVSWAVAVQFTNAITRPLHEISSKMEKMKDNDFEFIPRNYRYEELTIISDTTLRLTKELRAHVNKLEKEKKIRQEFFSNASHELKTPITSIKGYTELLEAGFVQDEPTKRDFMQRILKETENMTSLINDILMISQQIGRAQV